MIMLTGSKTKERIWSSNASSPNWIFRRRQGGHRNSRGNSSKPCITE